MAPEDPVCRKLRFQFLALSLSSENGHVDVSTLLSQIVTQDPHLQILFATSLQPLSRLHNDLQHHDSASTNLIRRVIVDGFPPRFNVSLMLGRSSTRL
jgi:hypothetical protein